MLSSEDNKYSSNTVTMTESQLTSEENTDKSKLVFNISSGNLEDTRWLRACVAGSIAGLTEHFCLYPIDTIKTRLQSVLHNSRSKISYRGFNHALTTIVQTEGIVTLFRGLPAVLSAAIPSHAAYFGAYEYTKFKIGYYDASNTLKYNPFLLSLSGICATMAHDLIVTPFDVVKQRMQLKGCPYPNVCKCAIDTFSKEGYLSFFRSYPATVLLNIPVFCTNFVTYEFSKIFLKDSFLSNEESWQHHLLAGGFAGACAGLISNPLDIIKTTIQVNKDKSGYIGIRDTVKQLYNHDKNLGFRIFMSGSTARILYFIPSAAITWTTYEAVKRFLSFPVDDLERH